MAVEGEKKKWRRQKPPPKQTTECDWSWFWKGLPPVDKNVHYSEHIVIKKTERS